LCEVDYLVNARLAGGTCLLRNEILFNDGGETLLYQALIQLVEVAE